VVLPISAFVAAGFEHSVANMYFIPAGWLIKDQPAVVDASGLTSQQLSHLNLQGFATNVAAATIGNVIGGAVMVGVVYWFVYLREDPDAGRVRSGRGT